MINLYQQAIPEEDDDNSRLQKVPSILVRIQEKIDFERMVVQNEKQNAKIKEISQPKQVGKRFNDFLERNSNFEKIKINKMLQNSQISKEQELNECSFKPKTKVYRRPKNSTNKCEVIYQGKRLILQ